MIELYSFDDRVSNHEAFSIIQTIKQLIESRRIITPQQDSMPSPMHQPTGLPDESMPSTSLPPCCLFTQIQNTKKLLTLNVGASIMQLLNKSTRAEIIKRIREPPNSQKKHLTSLPVTL
jgi:hypothetical protein